MTDLNVLIEAIEAGTGNLAALKIQNEQTQAMNFAIKRLCVPGEAITRVPGTNEIVIGGYRFRLGFDCLGQYLQLKTYAGFWRRFFAPSFYKPQAFADFFRERTECLE
jgi:hypothetical protein